MSVRRHEAQSPTPAKGRARLQEVLDIGEQLRLAKLVDLGDDTGPKMGKEKAAKDTPYTKKEPDPTPTDLKKVPQDDLPKPTHAGLVVQTVKNQIQKSTEIEREWLRTTYGNNWSKADPLLRTRMQTQARHALSFKLAPLIIIEVEKEEAAATKEFSDKHFNADGLPVLSWTGDVMPYLQSQYPPPLDWRKNESGAWLTSVEKDARTSAAKTALRPAKQTALEAELGVFVAERADARRLKTIEELNYPDGALKRKARALLRHWFNRKGKPDANGIADRVWNKQGEDKEEDAEAKIKKPKAVATDVPKEMHNARLKWAKSVVGPGYDPMNPPTPPSNLYMPLDIPPIPAEYLPDAVAEISAAGGQWLWTYMRSLEQLSPDQTDYSATLYPMEQSTLYWDSAFRTAQKAMLTDAYLAFMESVDEMSDVPQAKAIAYSYTVSSTRFNKYLLWSSDKVGGDPTKIPASGAGIGGVMGNTGNTPIGPPDALHRLYKLINRCPRLPQPTIFLRGVRTSAELPHNLGKAAQIQPEVGRGYVNVTFMSTSSAMPDMYTVSILAGFYSHHGPDDGCCLYAITCPKGSPVLPLVLTGADGSAYASEQEVLLPPGLMLVYQGKKRMAVGINVPKMPFVHFYEARLPPKTAVSSGGGAAGTPPGL